LLERKIIRVLDALADPEFTYAVQKVGGFRTLLGVPLLREGSPIGVMTLGRDSVRPFTDKQIELATTFADHLQTPDGRALARTCMRAREKSLKNFGLVPLRRRHVQLCRALAVIMSLMPTSELFWLGRRRAA
jgi:GAF domain-containing protein